MSTSRFRSNWSYKSEDVRKSSSTTELDLLRTTKPTANPHPNSNGFYQIHPRIRRLIGLFDSLCPNVYRVHCSDSLRILKEILCLADEYLHVRPSLVVSVDDLFNDERHFDDFISKLRYRSIYSPKSFYSFETKFRCFGQGIQTYHFDNELDQTLVFCCEWNNCSKRVIDQTSIPFQIEIIDPNGKEISSNVRYIHTYHQGETRLFSVSYRPENSSGIYKISFHFENQRTFSYSVVIRDSIKKTSTSKRFDNENLKKKQQEIPPYELEGDGHSKKIIVNSTSRFRLRLLSKYSNSTIDLFSLSIIDPHGHPIVVQRRLLSPDLLELIYQPMSIGEHQLTISFLNRIHRQLTIDVVQEEIHVVSKLRPFGPGLRRAIGGFPTEFYVDLNQTTSQNIHFRLEPSYQAEIDYEKQIATVRYFPIDDGLCPIHILDNDRDIHHSPFVANIEKKISTREKPKLRVFGLTKDIFLHRQVEFQVFVDNPFDDPKASLFVEILTDSQSSPTVTVRRRHRSSYICSFTPTTLGRHWISVDYAGIVAELNPFYSQAIQSKDIFLSGPAMKNQCLKLHQPTHFTFKLKDLLVDQNLSSIETNSTSESGYSSNDENSSKSSSSNDIPTSYLTETDQPYRVTITDGHGNVKSNVQIQELCKKKNENDVRVDFTPDEQILYINISCSW